MYQKPMRYYYRQPFPVRSQDRRRLSLKETLWRRSWPRVFTIILALLMLLFSLIIFSLEIASLAIDSTDNLSNTASTGAGIWCSLVFMVPVTFMFLLVMIYDGARLWSTYTLITHLVALVFVCVLIGLDANAITPYNTMVSKAPVKIQVLRGQLAVAVLMLLFPLGYFAAYIYAAFASLTRRHPHLPSIHPPFPVASDFAKY